MRSEKTKAKRPLSSSAGSSSDSSTKKRAVTAKSVDKWILDHDKDINTTTWLQYEMADCYHVAKLKCTICTQFVDKIRGSKNFNPAFIDGSTNLRTSSFKDHAKSDMHERAMLQLKKEQSTDVRDYAPIAKSLYRMDSSAEKKVMREFDIAYMMANTFLTLVFCYSSYTLSLQFTMILLCPSKF